MTSIVPTKFKRFLDLPMKLQLQIWQYAAVAKYHTKEAFFGIRINLGFGGNVLTAGCLGQDKTGDRHPYYMAELYNNSVEARTFKSNFEGQHPLATLMRLDTRKSLPSACHLSRMIILETWKAALEAMVLEVRMFPERRLVADDVYKAKWDRWEKDNKAWVVGVLDEFKLEK